MRIAVAQVWKEQTGQVVAINQSHGGSGKQGISRRSAWSCRCGICQITAAMAYARRHLLEINHQPADPPQFRAALESITTAGPLVKVEAATETGTVVYVSMPLGHYRHPGLRKGDEVFVGSRNMQVFPQHANGVRRNIHVPPIRDLGTVPYAGNSPRVRTRAASG